MFQNNPLLAQLKTQLKSQTPRITGIVKSHDKGYGFIETENKESYFISSQNMKLVLNGDKVSGVIEQNGDKKHFVPEVLIDSSIKNFIAKVVKINKEILIVHEQFNKNKILAQLTENITHTLKVGDYVYAKITHHALNENSKGFKAEITKFITEYKAQNYLSLIALARQQIESKAPIEESYKLNEEDELLRYDLTNCNFFTIDSQETQDMDDAISISKDELNQFHLQIAIADPSSYIKENSNTDLDAFKRCFTSYLPGFTVPMLPQNLANDLCSLKEHEIRSAVVCNCTILADGTIDYSKTKFSLACIKSKAKLSYSDVAKYINLNQSPHYNSSVDAKIINNQLQILSELCEVRRNWRKNNAVMFKDQTEYRFILDNTSTVIDIIIDQKLISHQMVEEAMIIANQAFTDYLQTKLGFGIFNIHSGYDEKYFDTILTILNEFNIQHFDKAKLSELEYYRALRKLIDDNELLSIKLRRYQAPAEFSSTPKPHFGLGFNAYATWTSPIRKYGDLTNHRLLKSVLGNQSISEPTIKQLNTMADRRKAVRSAEREVKTRLYFQFLSNKLGEKFTAQIIDINKGGAKVKILSNGAMAFLPLTFIHDKKEEITIDQATNTIKIKEQIALSLLDEVMVVIAETKEENYNIIVKLAQ